MKYARGTSLFLILSLILSFSLPAFAKSNTHEVKTQVNAPVPPSETGEYIVKMRKSVSKSAINSMMSKFRAKVLKQGQRKALIKLEKAEAIQTLKKLSSDPNIEYVEPNLRLRASELQPLQESTGGSGEPLFGNQWGLTAIHAPKAWGEITNPSKVTVAVIDTGADYTHPELHHRVDTTQDWDFVNEDNDAMDDQGHGTFVSGVVAAEVNGKGISGVAGSADVAILPIKVLNYEGYGSLYDISMGIQYAADHNADIINMSLGGMGYSRTMEEAVTYANDKGILVVAAAGNESDDVARYIPASLPGVMAIGSVSETREPSYFSNYGKKLDLAAPGERILSAFPSSLAEKEPENEYVQDNGSYYLYADGTSAASPFVAGIAALVKAQNPTLTGKEIGSRLIDSAVDKGDAGFDERYGYGLVNAYFAIKQNQITPTIKINTPTQRQSVWGTVDIKLEVNQPQAGKNILLHVKEEGTNGEISIASIPMAANKTIYSYKWDTNLAKADGLYVLGAKLEENPQISDSVVIDIRNQSKSGLQFSVLNPDHQPASSAYVMVVHKDNRGDGQVEPKPENEEESDFWYDVVYEGFTDENGYLRVPGTVAVDGNEFEVYVVSYMENKEETPVLYHRDIEGPTLQVIDASHAQKVNIQLNDLTGKPLSNAMVAVDFYDGKGNPAGWSLPMGLTDGKGQLTAYLDKGQYAFQAISSNDSSETDYLLMTAPMQVGAAEDVQTITFDLNQTGKLQLDYSDERYQDSFLFLSGYGMVFHAQKGKSIVVSPGQYKPSVALMVAEGSNSWVYFLAADQGITVGSGETKTLQAGGSFTSRIDAESTTLAKGDWLEGSAEIRDQYGNLLAGEFYFNRELASSLSQNKFAFRGKNGHIRFLNWDPGKKLNEGIKVESETEFHFVDPALRILQDDKLIDSPKIFIYFYNLFYPTERLALGHYQAQLYLNGGPLGETLSNLLDFEVADHTDSSQVSRVIGVDDKTLATEPYFAVIDPSNEGAERYIFATVGDDTGKVDISGLHLEEGKEYDVIVQAWDEAEGPILYWKSITAQTDLSAIHLSETKPVRLQANVENGGSKSELTVTLLDQNGSKISTEYAGEWHNGNRKLRIMPGTYHFSLTIEGTEKSKTSYYLAEDHVTINENSTVVFHPEETVELSAIYHGSNISWGGVGVFNPLNQQGMIFKTNEDWTVKLTPDTYGFAHFYEVEDHEGSWGYVLWDSHQDVNLQNDLKLDVGGAYSASLNLEHYILQSGDWLTGETNFTDSYGNRLQEVIADPYSEEDLENCILLQDKNGKIHFADKKHAKNKDSVEAKNHDLIAPILNIFDSQGKKIVYKKDGSHYDQVKQEINQLFPEGNYTAEVALGVGSSGLVKAQQSFRVTERKVKITSPADGAKIDHSPVQITGEAPAGSKVDIFLEKDNTPAATTTADPSGQFSVDLELDKNGHYTIYAAAAFDGDQLYSEKVTVQLEKKIKRISANMTKLSVKPGGTEKIVLTAAFADGTKQNVTDQAEWMVKDDHIAIVDKGIVTIKDFGKTAITAKYGGYSVSIAVEVGIKSLTANKKKLSIKPEATEQIELTAVLADGTKENVTEQAEWSTKNSEVADVESGKMIANGIGKTTITAKYGGKTVNISVTVRK